MPHFFKETLPSLMTHYLPPLSENEPITSTVIIVFRGKIDVYAAALLLPVPFVENITITSRGGGKRDKASVCLPGTIISLTYRNIQRGLMLSKPFRYAITIDISISGGISTYSPSTPERGGTSSANSANSSSALEKENERKSMTPKDLLLPKEKEETGDSSESLGDSDDDFNDDSNGVGEGKNVNIKICPHSFQFTGVKSSKHAIEAATYIFDYLHRINALLHYIAQYPQNATTTFNWILQNLVPSFIPSRGGYEGGMKEGGRYRLPPFMQGEGGYIPPGIDPCIISLVKTQIDETTDLEVLALFFRKVMEIKSVIDEISDDDWKLIKRGNVEPTYILGRETMVLEPMIKRDFLLPNFPYRPEVIAEHFRNYPFSSFADKAKEEKGRAKEEKGRAKEEKGRAKEEKGRAKEEKEEKSKKFIVSLDTSAQWSIEILREINEVEKHKDRRFYLFILHCSDKRIRIKHVSPGGKEAEKVYEEFRTHLQALPFSLGGLRAP